MRTARLLWTSALSAILFAASLTAAAAVPLRITAAVDDSTRAALPNAVSPRLKAAVDLGAAPADQPLSLSIRFSMTTAQQTALTTLLANLQDPSSASYHRWLTPEQYAAQFGLAPADIATVSSWLTQQGFTVTGVARGGQFVTFTGTVAQAEQAFATSVHRVQVNGVTHIANVTAPSVPAALASVTLAVTGLDDFTPTPRALVHSVRAPASTATTGGVQPEFTSQISGNTYIAPGDIYKIYDVSPALSANINGTGVTIAVVGQADITLSDIAAFRSVSGLSASAPTVQLYGTDPGSASATDVAEAEMAVEWAGAAAPSASILYVNSNAVIDASLTEAIDNNVAPIIADVYGECEAGLGASKLAYYNQLLAQAAAQGITVTAPSGNSGATDCDYGSYPARNGPAVDFPGSSPYVVAIGGTEFNEGTGTYWSTTNGTNQASALSYIPEVAWNDTSSANGLLATGGGASLYFPKPSWQTGTGVPHDLARDTPDVSLSASIQHDGYLVCVAPFCVSGGYASAGGYLDIAGGTDLASAEFAGFMALVVQKTGARVGVANNTLYALANSSTYAPSVFHDITTGNNDSPCTTGTTDCPASGVIGFTAAAGYDQTTGWGSVDVFNMVTDWPLVTPITTTPAGTTVSVTNLSASPASVTAGTAITLTVTVASGNSTVTSTPSGTVSFAIDGVATGASVTLSGGTQTYTLATGSLSAGNHLVQAAYSGDATFSGSIGAFTINVASATGPDFTLTPSTAAISVASGAISSGAVFTVTPVNGFTGTVTFQIGAPSGFEGNVVFSNPSVSITGTTAASTTLTVLAYTPVLARSGTGELSANTRSGWRSAAGTGIAFASLLFLLVPRRRRMRLPALLAMLLLAGAVTLSGCSSSNSGSSTTPRTNTPAGTYTLTVSATGTVNGASVTHSSIVTLTVQ